MNSMLLKNGIIYNSDNNKFEKKDMLIEEGKIKAISENIQIDIKNVKVIEVKNNYIFPGIIDCHTHLGIIEEATGKIGVDNNETSAPITPHLNSIDGINPFDIAFMDAVSSGVTCVMSGPGSNNVVGGQNIAIKTCGRIIDKMVIKNPSGFKIALGENPLSTYGKNDKCPVTRMGIAASIRELFMKAQDYMVQKENGKLEKREITLEAVIPVLKGHVPLRAHAHRADDIVTAIRIAGEFNITDLVIEHGTEAFLVKDYIKEKEVPVAFGPMLTPRIKMELKSRSYHSVMELVEAGIKVALITDHPYNSIEQLRTVAALAMSEGLSYKDAVKTLTVNPAEILKCGERIGQLKPGYDADIVIYNGNPMELKTKVLQTIINGEVAFTNPNFNL